MEKVLRRRSEGTGDSGEKTFQDIAEQNCRKEIFSTELQDGSVKEEGDAGVKKSCFESFGLRKFSFSSSVSEPDGESPKIKRQATVGLDGIIEPASDTDSDSDTEDEEVEVAEKVREEDEVWEEVRPGIKLPEFSRRLELRPSL